VRHSKLCVLLLALCSFAQQTLAGEKHPVFMKQGFQFDQIDKICVMPMLDARKDPTPTLDLRPMRPLVMLSLEARGYHIAAPGCSAAATGGSARADGSRWLLTVRVDALFPTGSVLTASLFDSQAGEEVLRDTAMPGFGGRYKNALELQSGYVPVNQLIKGAINPVLATFEKKNPRSSHEVHHGPDEMWEPQSVYLLNNRDLNCSGVLKLDSKVLSFDPPKDKCQKYAFSVPVEKVKTLGFNHYGVFHVDALGKNYYFTADKDDDSLNYLIVAWENP